MIFISLFLPNMKIKHVILTLLVLSFLTSKAQVPIAYYDFEDNLNRNTTVETNIQEAVSSIGSPVLSVSSLSASNGAGNGTSIAYGGGSNAGYAIGYYGFTTNLTSASTNPHIQIGPFDCTGFSTLSVSMDIQGVGAQMPTNVDIYYSINGITYTRINVTTAVTNSYTTRTFNIPAAANNQSTVYFRIVGFRAGASPTPSDGVMKVDNFTLNSSIITANTTLVSSSLHGTGLSSGGSFIPTYSSLNIDGIGITVNTSSNFNLGTAAGTTALTLTNGVFNVGNNTLTLQRANTLIARNGTSQIGTITLGSAANLIFGTTGNTSGNAFTIPANTFTVTPSINNLTINRTNLLTWNAQGITLDGTLTLTAGALSVASGTFTFQNNATPIVRTAGTLTVTAGSNLVFGANASNFTLPNGLFTAAPSLGNLTINRVGGVTVGNQSFTINGTLNLTDGVFNILNTTLSFQTGATPITRTSGTITTATASSLTFGTNATSFTIPDNTFTAAPAITNLTINRAGGVTIGNQPFTINGRLTLTAGVFNVLNTTLTFQNNSTPLARTSGTLTLGSTANLVFGTPGNTGGNAFTIPANTFTVTPSINNLTINRTNLLTWNAQGITLDGTLTLTAGALSVATGTFTFQNNTTPIVRTAGTLTVTTGSNLVFGTNASNFTLPNGLFTAAPSLGNLTINRVGGVTVGNQSFTINGTLNLTEGVFNILNTTLSFQTGATPITRTSGTITTATASSLSFGTNATSFTIPDNTFTSAPSITNLTVNRAGGITIGNQPFTINGTLTLTAGVFNVLNSTLTFQNGNTPIARTTGTLTLGSTANLIFGTPGNVGGNAFTIPASTFTATPSINNLTINRTNVLTWNTQGITLDGVLTLTAGALSVATGTFTFQNNATPIVRTAGTLTVTTGSNLVFGTNASNFTLPNGLFTAAPSLGNLTINRVGGVTIGNQAFTINGTLNLTNGVFDILNTSLIFQTGATPITRTAGTLTIATASSLTFGTNATSFTIPDNTFTSAPSITNLTVNRAGGITLGNQSFTINGSLTLTAGVLNVAATTLSFQNATTPIVRTGGTLTLTTNSNLIFGANAANFTLPNSLFTTTPSFNNLTVNRNGGITLGNQSITINGTLTLTSGVFNIVNNTLTLQNSDIPLARTSGTLTVGTTASIIFGTPGNTGGAAFTIPNNFFTATPPVFASFTMNRTNELVLNATQGLTLSTNLNLLSGTLNNAGRNIGLTGNISGTGTVSGAGTITMTGASTTISGASISNLQLDNAAGFSLTGSPTITNTLTLTNGNLSVGANTVTFHTGNIPIARTTGLINLATTSSLVFGTAGNTGGNAFAIPNNTFGSSTPLFNNFTINRTNDLTLNNQNFSIRGTLNIIAGRLILPTSYLFTLKSTSITNTAMVSTVGATGSILYNTGAAFRVERFVGRISGNGVRAYRDFSSSVNTGTSTIFSNWQENGTNGLDGGFHYGTHITGVAGASPGGVDGATGFDITSTGSKSLFTYDISTIDGSASWNAANSTNQTNDTLSAFKGYRLFVRGNRLINLYAGQPPILAAGVVLRSTGKLVTGDVVYSTTGVTANGGSNNNIRLNSASASGYTHIGNPYASIVNWDTLYADAATTNISSSYTIYDPNVGTNGGFAVYNSTSGISAPVSSAINEYIQPGQAFFIQNTSVSPSITIKETHKATNVANFTNTFRNSNVGSKLYVNLLRNVNTADVLMDGVALAFNEQFSNEIGKEDAFKISNTSENISIINKNNQLAIEGRKQPTVNDTFYFKIDQLVAGVNYKLEVLSDQFIINGLQAFLIDKFTNTEMVLPIGTNFRHSFTTNSNVNSFNQRFIIVFKPLTSLSVNFIQFHGTPINDYINLKWEVKETDIVKYNIERSSNGQEFTYLGELPSTSSTSNSLQNYQWNDLHPLNNQNYYRIKAIGKDGKIVYSKTILIQLQKRNSEITIYPNPVKQQTFNLYLQDVDEANNLNVRIYSLSGVLVHNVVIRHTSATSSHIVSLPNLAKATYIVKVLGKKLDTQLKLFVE